MAYSNKEWLNQFKSTNNNINEINNKMLSTIENLEKENVNKITNKKIFHSLT